MYSADYNRELFTSDRANGGTNRRLLADSVEYRGSERRYRNVEFDSEHFQCQTILTDLCVDI